ncbi:hypothetical protein [Streptomyces laurentii]|uniref:hypothetical protein n=1 Tax=Streptomyces laurentii TaxID=39478 RepID=UPI0036B602FF
MTEEPMTEEDRMHQEVHEMVVAHFREGVRALARAVDELDDDIVKALAHITWFAMQIAENAQATTVNLTVEGPGADRYLSMGGMLCGPRGELVSIGTDEFPTLLGRLNEAVSA